MSVEFVGELPGKGTATGDPSGWQQELKANPGQWAILPITSNSNAAAYYRPKGFEIVERTVDGQKHVYGRFVGMEREHA